MGYTAKKLVAIAVAEIGYKEKASNSSLDSDTANAGSANYTKYARDLAEAGYYNGNKNGYAWCDVFVDWCFYQLTGKNKTRAETLECQTGELGAGCVYSKQYYKAAGRLDTTPKVGDQVFFQSGGTVSHTGIVETVTLSQITTVEGNSSDQVKRKTYSRSDSCIDSYGHPKYDEDSSSTTAASTTSTKAAATTTAKPETIWNYLLGKIGNAYGVAGLMGNLYAESALIPNNLQNTGNTKLGMTDAEYTAAVDDGSYTKFSSDGYGYGLCQWTYSTRKAALLTYAEAQNASVGNLDMQLAFIYKEISESYSSLLSTLKSAASVKEASDAVLTKYEKPADQSDSVKTKRAGYGQTYYDKYAGSSSSGTSTSSSGSTTNSSSATTSAVTEKKATDSAKSFNKSLAGTYKVNASSGLNMRNGAGTSKKLMTTLKNGTKVQNYGYYTTCNGVKWLYCQVTVGSVKYTGFLCSTYLTKQ